MSVLGDFRGDKLQVGSDEARRKLQGSSRQGWKRKETGRIGPGGVWHFIKGLVKHTYIVYWFTSKNAHAIHINGDLAQSW